MPMRLSGLMSGMDTESIIKELVAVKQTKVDDAKKAQKKLQWKQDAWKDLNGKLLKFYDKVLGTMRFESDYMKKVTKISDPNAVTVITGEGAMNSVQSLVVTELAQTNYLTGGKLGNNTSYTQETKLTDAAADGGLGIAAGSTIEVQSGGRTSRIEITAGMTIKDFVIKLQDTGISASFDESQQRFFASSKKTGKDEGFQVVAADSDGAAALDRLGLSYYGTETVDYFQGIVDRQAATTTQRIQSRLDGVLNGKKNAEKTKEDLMKKVADNYSSYFTGIDMTAPDAPDQIKDRIEAMDHSSAVYRELSKWGEQYDAAETALASAQSLLIETGTDSEGNPVYDLVQSEKDSITAEVQAEVDHAQDMLGQIAASTDPTTGTVTKGTAENKTLGKDATILLNGVEYTSNTNTFAINGLTLTVNAKTDPTSPVTITTMDDTDGIYDMIRGFIKEYNTLVNEMDKLYNADSAKGYEPLTDEEKDALPDSEVEEWEKKIKDAILRKDTTLSTVSGAMKEIMMTGVNVNGRDMYLNEFGIETLSYFLSAENEKNAYHIAGDSDDEYTSNEEDKLKSMIADDPDTVIDFFTGLSRKMYTKMTELMTQTDYSSGYTVYEDKKMKEDYDDYTSTIKDLEKKLADYEDKWYAKFAAMETALAKLQSNASAVTSLLGG